MNFKLKIMNPMQRKFVWDCRNILIFCFRVRQFSCKNYLKVVKNARILFHLEVFMLPREVKGETSRPKTVIFKDVTLIKAFVSNLVLKCFKNVFGVKVLARFKSCEKLSSVNPRQTNHGNEIRYKVIISECHRLRS